MNPSIKKTEPVFSISTAARLLKISVHTLRMYEREGLIIPYKKKSNQRLYSQADLDRIQCIRDAINQAKISINGIKSIYSLIPCWDIIKCSAEEQKECASFNGAHNPCWTYDHKNVCKERDCRTCEVYTKYSQCGTIKELIKSVSR
ncbi:MAG: MerR family transcriptional regulator [Ignavibacteriae bacterium HGW-Ignavibacteriae-3]|nr:MAG: MerR family transcriptional regulator [Ignavibacteriae bacterium HGW-Ignavibacteriae-3]